MARSIHNVLDTPLEVCSLNPKSGFVRNGYCEYDPRDPGEHTVCAVMTAEFLTFSKMVGNDLSTPRLEYDFPGLKPGDRWCVCASRWKEAFEAGAAPRVVLKATHKEALHRIPLEDLKSFGTD